MNTPKSSIRMFKHIRGEYHIGVWNDNAFRYVATFRLKTFSILGWKTDRISAFLKFMVYLTELDAYYGKNGKRENPPTTALLVQEAFKTFDILAKQKERKLFLKERLHGQ